MILIDEIKKKKEVFWENSSNTEKAFFYYLCNRTVSSKEFGDDLIVKILAKEKNINISEIQKIKSSKPIKGLHYSNNLISLVSFALFDYESEKRNLKTFFDSNSLKEQYIISTLFSEMDIKSAKHNKNSSVDDIISEVLINKRLDNIEQLLLNALQDSNDLLDLFIIEKTFEYSLNFHPNKIIEKKYKSSVECSKKLFEEIERRYYKRILIFSLFVLLVYLAAYSYISVNYWNTFEPIANILNVIFSVGIFFIFVAGLLLYNKTLDKTKMIATFKENVRYKLLSKILKKTDLITFMNNVRKSG